MSTDSLSHSRAYAYQKCKKAYAFKYLDKVKPLPHTLHLDSWERMQRGILTHRCMEAGFLGEDMATALNELVAKNKAKYGGYSDEQEARLGDMLADAIEVATAALEWLPISDWEPVIDRNGKPMIEAELRLPLPGWKDFVGYADAVLLHKPSRSQFVVDYKIRANFERDDADRFNSQFALYQKALGDAGVRVVGSLLFEIKPTPPKRASRVVRVDDGGVSSVRVSADGRFRTIPTLRSPEFIDNFWDDFKKTALAMTALRSEDAYRNMSAFSCGFCDYEKLCMADLRGDDVLSVLARHYSVPEESLRIVEEL